MSLLRDNRIWNFFKLDDKDKGKAVCLLCVSATKNQIPKNKMPMYIHMSTKPLWNHLELKHETRYKEAKLETDYYLGSNPFLNYDKQEAAIRHLTFDTALEKNKYWCLKQKNAKEITYLVGEMLCLANMPVKTVENIGFKRLFSRAEPRFPIPLSSHFSNNILPDIYDRIRYKIRDGLVNASIVSLTTDIWTSNNGQDIFLTFTAHWIDKDLFQRRKAVLNSHHFGMEKRDDQIRDRFYELFDIWNLNLSSIHVVMQDNACDFRDGTKEFGIPTIDCFIQSLHSCVHNAVFKHKSVVDVLDKARRIVTYFNSSKVNNRRLREFQDRCKMKHVKQLVMDEPKRWQSTFYMLDVMFQLKRAIVIYMSEFTEMEVPAFTGNQWALMAILMNVLKPLEEITKQASSPHEGLSVVIPYVFTIIKFLSKQSENDHAFSDNLLETVSRTFLTEEKLLSSKYHVMATALDPRFMFAFFPNSETKRGAKVWICEDLMGVSIDDANSIASSRCSNDDKRKLTLLKCPSNALETTTDIWRCLDDLGKTGDSQGSTDVNLPIQKSILPVPRSKTPEADEESVLSTGSDTKRKLDNSKTFEKEIQNYQNRGRINHSENPLNWWKDQAAELPNLSKLVPIALSCPSSHVDSSASFCEPGTTYEEDRDRTLPRYNDRHLFINKNLPLFNYEY